MNNIGKRIKALREESKMSQAQLGRIVGCSGQVISNIERDYSRPTTEMINKIASHFNVPGDYILGMTEEKWAANNSISSVSLSKRILECMDHLQMDMHTFITSSTLSESVCQEILSDKLIPNIDTLAKIAYALNTSIDYLVGNSDFHIIVESEDECDIIQNFRNMTKREKRIFLGMMEEAAERFSSKV